jgi:hypothetical protein
LSHYWTADDPAEVRQAQLKDWVDDLLEFGPEIVEEACTRWRRQPGGRRPTPGDIRAYCVEEQQDRARVGDALEAAREHKARHAAAESARGRAMQHEGRSILNAYAQRNGYPDIDAYALAMGIDHSEACCRVIAEGAAAASGPLARAANSIAMELGVTVKEIVED